MLVKAYINFLKKDYEKHLAEMLKIIIKEDIVCANYLEAMTYYVLIKIRGQENLYSIR